MMNREKRYCGFNGTRMNYICEVTVYAVLVDTNMDGVLSRLRVLLTAFQPVRRERLYLGYADKFKELAMA